MPFRKSKQKPPNFMRLECVCGPHNPKKFKCTIIEIIGPRTGDFKVGDVVRINEILYTACSGGGKINPFTLHLAEGREWADFLEHTETKQGEREKI